MRPADEMDLPTVIAGAPALDGETFDPAAMIRAVNRLVAAGQDAAAAALSAATDRPERALLLARALFTPADTAAETLAPHLGAADVGDRHDPADWPHFPLVLTDGFPFLLVGGYQLGGVPESPAAYIERCQRAGEFRTASLAPTITADAALKALLGSHRFHKLASAAGDEPALRERLRGQAARADGGLGRAG